MDEMELKGETWYLQPNKIEDMYGIAVGTIEIERRLSSQNDTITNISVDMGIKDPLHIFPFKAEVSPKYTKRNGKTIVITQQMPPTKKIEIAMDIFERQNLVSNLNEISTNGGKIKPYVYFKGKARFTIDQKNPKLVLVDGVVENIKFESTCSIEYIERISASLFQDLIDACKQMPKAYLPVFCVGNAIWQLENGSLKLSLYYIGGSIEEINYIYKKEIQ